MAAAPRFTPEVTDAHLRCERARARELRGSAWWKRRIAAGVCHYCERQVGAKALTMDHLVPLIRGGRSVRGNMVPACKDCNSKKRSLLPWEWEEYLRACGDAGGD
ncbi:MAG: HNH endonuclease [Candidatus Rokuibacteriota bacterium]|nr:MAG: HNH endonuclease [Candidatus Rokubacteria bacterium]